MTSKDVGLALSIALVCIFIGDVVGKSKIDDSLKLYVVVVLAILACAIIQNWWSRR